MSEARKLWIPGPVGRLEAVLRVAARPVATAVVAHPHPLHGGTLHNPVVFHAERALHDCGATTLRFNFRGVGASEGRHDAGGGEVEDLASAAAWVRGLAPAVPAVVVGYSFGAWCAVRLAERDAPVRALLAIGLPLRIYRFDGIGRIARPLAAVQGSDDELGPPAEVRRLLDTTRPRGRLYVVEGASHLFSGFARAAAESVGQAFADLLERVGCSDGPSE
jgi:hypothetical protein